MKKKIFFAFTAFTVLAAISASTFAVNTRGGGASVKAETSTTYDCTTEMKKIFNESYDGIGWATPFGVEAINLTEFFVTDQGVDLADENGVLPEDDEQWNHASLSLLTYPMYTNASLGLKFNQYPLGWRMNTESMLGQQGAWPDGNYSASMSWGAYHCDGWIHPDNGLGIVIYFTAPSDGTVYITDTVSAPSSTDGTNFCVYKIPAASFVTRSWNGQTHHGLTGGAPIYPSKGVSPTSSWSTGWKHVGTAASTYYSQNFEVSKGDVLAWIYGAGYSTASDATYTSPKVVYGTSPLSEAETFAEDYIHSPNGTTISYDDHTDTGACRGDEGYYATAKTQYNSLSNNAKTIFNSYDQFSNARARLQAWAVANGETIDFSSGAIVTNSLTYSYDCSIAIVACTIATISLVGLTILIKKKKKKRE